MLESALEKKCKQFIDKNCQGKFIKLQGVGNKGEPDRLIVLPNGITLFCELKKPGQKPSKLQFKKLRALRDMGHHVFWTSSYIEFCERVERIKVFNEAKSA